MLNGIYSKQVAMKLITFLTTKMQLIMHQFFTVNLPTDLFLEHPQSG